MDELLDALGFDTEDGDFGQLTNDENGCIYFNTDFIKTNDIKEPGLEACDLPINDKTIKIDSSNMRFKPKSKVSIGLIIGIIAAVIVVVVIIVIVVFVIKKKKKKMEEEEANENSSNYVPEVLTI